MKRARLVLTLLLLVTTIAVVIQMRELWGELGTLEKDFGHTQAQVQDLQTSYKRLRGQVEYQTFKMEQVQEPEEPEYIPPEEPVMTEEEFYSMLYPPTAEELVIMAKIVYHEARGITNRAEQAAVVWCILNRVDSGIWGDTIKEVATYPDAFAYIQDTPIDEDLLLLVADVSERWNYEKAGHEDVGRVLPKDYLYFTGDGMRNHFVTEYQGTNYWSWGLASPY